MPALRIETEVVESLAAQIKTEHDGTVTDLIGKLRGLNSQLDSAWDGPAQKQFETTYGDWVSELDKFANTLLSVNQYLVKVAEEFKALDEAARAAATSAGAGAA